MRKGVSHASGWRLDPMLMMIATWLAAGDPHLVAARAMCYTLLSRFR